MGLILVLLFAAALNLITRYYYFIFLAFAFFSIKSQRKLRADAPVGLLLLLALSWVVFSPTSTISVLGIFKPFTYVMCYMMGVGLFDDGIENNEEKSPYRLFYLVAVTLALGTLAHYVLNWVTNLGTADRNTVDIWTHDAMAATGQSSLACIPLGLSIAFLFSKTRTWVKILSATTVVVVILYNLVLSGRTLFIMLFVVTAIAFFHRLSMQKTGRMRVIVILLAIILLFVFVYQANLFNIREFIEGTPIYDRFFGKENTTELDEDGRMERKLYHLNNIDKAFFGGSHNLEGRGFAHDIILDTYDEGGIFALAAILGYLFISLSHLVRCVRDKSLPFVFRNTVLCVYVIVYLEFMVEPILQGMPWFFATFCLIDGYVSRILSHNRMINSKVR